MSTRRVPSDLGSFSESVATEGPGRWIYVSGQLGLDDDGRLVEGGVSEEAEAAVDQLERALQRAGAELADVVRITAYLTELEHYGEFNRVRANRFAGSLPASTAVQAAGLVLGASIEIDAVAFVTAAP